MRTVLNLMLCAAIAGAPACGDDDRAALAQLDTAPTLGDLDATTASDAPGPDGDTVLPATCVRDDDCASLSGALPCREPVCRADGTCGLRLASAGSACEGPCVVDGVCDDQGICGGGGVRACGDDDPCTDDHCQPDAGCVFTPRSCPDASACEVGVCEPTTGACGTRSVGDGESCDPGRACLVDAVCQDGACVGALSPACDDANPCTADSCGEDGCVHTPTADDQACDDRSACTTDDRCAAGVCAGAQISCDDHDPCTADTCFVGDCVNDPIPECVPPPGCADLGPGAACDDGDVGTVGDVCVAGLCRGFAATRFTPTGAAETWRFDHLDHAQERWFVGVVIDDAEDDAKGALARLEVGGDASPAVEVYGATRRAAIYTGLTSGFASDDTGKLWQFVAPGWTNDAPLPNALGNPGGRPEDLAVVHDADGTRIWLVGEDSFGGPWFRRCATTPITSCMSQALIINDRPIVRAVAADTDCDEDGECDVALAAGGDLFESTGADGYGRYFNDVYQATGGVGASWSVGAFDPGPSRHTTEAAVSLGDEVFLFVGGFGYMRENAPDGEWANPLVITEDQESYHFRGAWFGADVLAVVGFRLVPGGREQVLFTAPLAVDVSEPSVWTRHLIGTGVGPGVGVYDVHGTADGALVMVGGGRDAPTARGEGVVWVRQP